MHRTFVIGDIHGDAVALERVLGLLPALDAGDSMVFLGDYLDRGPDSATVMERVRTLHRHTPARVIALRGNHEDAWLRAVDEGFPEFVLPQQNGCSAAMRSYERRSPPAPEDRPTADELRRLLAGSFFPPEHVAWMRSLPFFHEDEHAIYVHAGIPRGPDGFPHPSAVEPRIALLWCRDRDFFTNYRGKLVVVGHTVTSQLPKELSSYTPEDPTDLWAGPCTAGIDTGCGKGGFLTALELPRRLIYESR